MPLWVPGTTLSPARVTGFVGRNQIHVWPGEAVAPPSFDPLADVGWAAAFWAGDPGWSNPGDGNPVGTWDDGTGNGYDVTASGGSRPTYRATVASLNNKPAVEFVRASSHGLALDATPPALSAPYSLVAILAGVGSEPANQNFISGATSSIYIESGASTAALYAGGSFSNSTTGTEHAIRALVNGASSAINVDGNNQTGNPGGAGFGSNLILSGYGGRGSDGFDGYMGFIGLYTGDVTSDGGWSGFVSWVSSEYGLTIA
jgi:hypothetical protein